MKRSKKIIGITGGSGVGKSYISELLREIGYPVIDADKTAHESINNADCRAELVAYFGAEIEKNGKIDRKKLGNIVFSNPEKLEKLNEITLKYIVADIAAKIEAEASETVFVDGATLIESGFKCDKMLCVTADYEVRKERIMERDGITAEAAGKRLTAQKPSEFYISHSDIAIVNNGDKIEIAKILSKII